MVVGRIQFSRAVGLRSSVLLWLLARSCPQFLAMWASPLGSPQHGGWLTSEQAGGTEREDKAENDGRQSVFVTNLRCDTPSLLPYSMH